MSSVGGWKVEARDSAESSAPASNTVTGTPARTRFAAAARPTGPAPAMKTRSCVAPGTANPFYGPSVVARTHQPGCLPRSARAAAVAARPESYSAKQVAPEPDMRASRHCAEARNAASTSAMMGWSATAGGSRSLRAAASEANSAAPTLRSPQAGRTEGRMMARQPREHVLRRDRHARIDQHRGQLRERERRRENLADAAHHPCLRIEADRHIGTGQPRGFMQTRVVERDAVVFRQETQRRRSIGGAAAEASRDRQALVERKAAGFQSRDALRQQPRRLEHEIVAGRAGGGRGRPARDEVKRPARRERHAIADVGEYDQAFDLVIAVGRRPITCSVRLTLAGANSARAARALGTAAISRRRVS